MKLAPCVAVAALAVAGCHEERPKRTAPVIARVAPDAAVASRVDARTLALAVAARDAATALAKRCRLYRTYDENAVHYHDDCSWGPLDLESIHTASTALLAAAPDSGDAVVFVEHVRLFREWIDLSGGAYPGALSHYQDLALAWNSFQPQDPIPIDVYSPDTGDRLPRDAGPFTWQRCASGPCVVILSR